ncbi:MAG: DUF308 domain-containing protein [Alphaproteobacteria bacterium]
MDLVDVLGGIGRGARLLGYALFALALLCVFAPVATGEAAILALGLLMLLAGLFRAAIGWRAVGLARGPLGLVVGLLTAAAGVALLLHPVAALTDAASLVAVYLVIDGIVGSLFGFRLRPEEGWTEAVGEGLLSVVLGICVWRGWPFPGVQAIGLVLALKLATAGLVLLRLPRTLARAEQRLLGLRAEVVRRIEARD